LYRRLGGPQGRSGRVRKISPPPRFDPRTVQPVASRYTDWATRPTINVFNSRLFTKLAFQQMWQIKVQYTFLYIFHIMHTLNMCFKHQTKFIHLIQGSSKIRIGMSQLNKNYCIMTYCDLYQHVFNSQQKKKAMGTQLKIRHFISNVCANLEY
jgi:hypothetical protein